MSDLVKESNRILKIRTTIIVGFVLVLQALAQYYDIPLPNFLNDITEMEDSTLLDIGSGLAVVIGYLGTIKFPRFENLFFFGKKLSREAFEFEGLSSLTEKYPLSVEEGQDEPQPSPSSPNVDTGAIRSLIREIEQNLDNINRLTS